MVLRSGLTRGGDGLRMGLVGLGWFGLVWGLCCFREMEKSLTFAGCMGEVTQETTSVTTFVLIKAI